MDPKIVLARDETRAAGAHRDEHHLGGAVVDERAGRVADLDVGLEVARDELAELAEVGLEQEHAAAAQRCERLAARVDHHARLARRPCGDAPVRVGGDPGRLRRRTPHPASPDM